MKTKFSTALLLMMVFVSSVFVTSQGFAQAVKNAPLSFPKDSEGGTPDGSLLAEPGNPLCPKCLLEKRWNQKYPGYDRNKVMSPEGEFSIGKEKDSTRDQ